MRNKYAGPCIHCSNRVERGEGYIQRMNGRFIIRCMSCVVEMKRGPLSDAQAAYVRTPCACGKGYASAYDGKCGHCRTKQERFYHRIAMEVGT